MLGSAVGGLALGFVWNELYLTKQSQCENPHSKLPAGSLYDFVVIGGGVCGVASLYGILSVRPGSRILLVEKDTECLHATLNDPVSEIRALQDAHGRVEQLPNVEIFDGRAATKLDVDSRTVTLQGGAPVQYKHGCLLATGREVRAARTPVPPSRDCRQRSEQGAA
jgi:NADPH-dependent 2,4-dienoyl-CoA reductase/sulfur reductase-like enzyme